MGKRGATTVDHWSVAQQQTGVPFTTIAKKIIFFQRITQSTAEFSVHAVFSGLHDKGVHVLCSDMKTLEWSSSALLLEKAANFKCPLKAKCYLKSPYLAGGPKGVDSTVYKCSCRTCASPKQSPSVSCGVGWSFSSATLSDKSQETPKCSKGSVQICKRCSDSEIYLGVLSKKGLKCFQ